MSIASFHVQLMLRPYCQPFVTNNLVKSKLPCPALLVPHPNTPRCMRTDISIPAEILVLIQP